MDKSSEDSINYGASRVPSDCHYTAGFGNSTMGDLPNPPSYFSSMMDSFAPPSFWENSANLHLPEFNNINAHSGSNTLDKLGPIKGPGSLTATGLEPGWVGPDSILKGSMLMPTGPGAMHHSLPQFPADSAFIERAARFSCFSAGSAADVVNPFGMCQPVNPYHQVNAPSTSKEESPRKAEEKNCGNDDDAKQAGSDEEPSLIDADAERSSATGISSKKRKRGAQETATEQQCQQQSGEDDKDDSKQNCSVPTTNKGTGKNAKQNPQVSDSSREGYIHVRARRGQATNSHSLAERVRREKISERMKFLQDLVPGCNKVTGKAVMLDEIINYVQSLQRQVEFLSMKLATVNPRLDCNIESLLAKDQMFGTRSGPPLMGFSPNIPILYPPLHPSQSAAIQSGFPIIGSSSDAQGNANSQLTSIGEGYKEPTQQMHNLWDDELHNVIQMGFNPNASPDNQDTSSSLPPGHMKAEP